MSKERDTFDPDQVARSMSELGMTYSPQPTDADIERWAAVPRGKESEHCPAGMEWLPALCRIHVEWSKGHRISKAHLGRIQALESKCMALLNCGSHWRDLVHNLCGNLDASPPALPDPKSLAEGVEWVPYDVVVSLMSDGGPTDHEVERAIIDAELERWWEGYHETQKVRAALGVKESK